METRKLGGDPLTVSAVGIGVWAWGDTRYWGYGHDFGLSDVEEAYETSVEAGITFFDTAEIYGAGASERILGGLVRRSQRPVAVATKYAPLPWRFSTGALHKALDASLDRLGLDHIDLYQVHFPLSLVRLETLMDALADAVAAGKVRYVGVSNYSATKMRRAHEALALRGIPLASNQVAYSLLRRSPEVDGVLDACRDLRCTLIAYSPLAQGLLTGKYRPGASAPGLRRLRREFRDRSLRAAMPVVQLLEEIARTHGRTPAQVALNWLMRQDPVVVPIPGVKNRQQAAEAAGAVGWRMAEEEAEALDTATLAWRR